MTRLLDDTIDRLDRLEKRAFEPMPGGAPAADPAMMDPAMAAGAVDPMMAAGAGPAASSPPPVAANVPPAASSPAPAGGIPPEIHDALVGVVRQVVQEMGVGGGGGSAEGGEGSKPAKDMEARLGAVEGALAQVLEMLGLANPQQALTQAVEESAPAGMSSGSGTPADAPAEAAPMPMGPMSPGAPGAMAEMNVPTGMPGMQVSASAAPLDKSTVSHGIADAVRQLRERKGL